LSRKKWQIFSAIRSHFESTNLKHFTSYPKSQKRMKVVLWQLPVSAPAEDFSDGLVNHGFGDTGVKQMYATHRSPVEGTTTVNIRFFLTTVPSTAKSQETLKLTSLCHIAIRVEVDRAQTGLAHCYNCKQPPRFI
jgi:hypothetical protein